MNKKTKLLTVSAVIGALYAVLTIVSAALSLAYGGVQFRISEALTILPIFFPSAISGLTVGCAAANLFSSVSPLDAIIGSLATLTAAVLTRKLRHITVKGFPLLSFLSPVVINGILVGAEIAFFAGEGSFLTAFLTYFFSVSVGEAAVVFTLGVALFRYIRKNSRLEGFISSFGTAAAHRRK